MTPEKHLEQLKKLDREIEYRLKKVEMVNQVFNSFFPKLVPPNPSEVKVEKPLMYSDFERGVNNA